MGPREGEAPVRTSSTTPLSILRTSGACCSYDHYEQDLHTRTDARSLRSAPGLCRRLPRRTSTHKKQATWSGVYLEGLLQDGERKSIEPLSGRVTLPPGLDAKDPEQALQQFVNQSPWDDQELARALSTTPGDDLRQPRGDLRLRRHQLPQAGEALRRRPEAVLRRPGQEGQLPGRPLGPLRQPQGPLPAGDAAVPAGFLDRGQAPAGPGGRARRPSASPRPRAEIALELLDMVRGEGLPGWLAVADAGYGISEDFREGLAATGTEVHRRCHRRDGRLHRGAEWEPPGPAARPEGTGGRPRRRPRLAEGSPRPVSLKELAAATTLHEVTWREGTKGELSGHFAWLRVWPGGGWATGDCAYAEPIWLLIERQADGKLKYAFSNLPADTTLAAGGRAVEEPVAGGAGLPTDEGRIGPGSFRGPLVAGLPPPYLPGDAGVRFPGAGTTSREGATGGAGEKRG